MIKMSLCRLSVLLCALSAPLIVLPAGPVNGGSTSQEARFQQLRGSSAGDSLRAAKLRAVPLSKYRRHAGEVRKLNTLIRRSERLNARLERLKKRPGDARRREARRLLRDLADLKRDIRALRRDVERRFPATPKLSKTPRLRSRTLPSAIPRGRKQADQAEIRRKREEKIGETADAVQQDSKKSYEDAKEQFRDALRILQESAERKSQVVQKFTS